MKNSLKDYTIREIEGMADVVGNANYDVYDKIMNGVCWEFDEVINNDNSLFANKSLHVALKQLNMFVFSFIVNKKMRLTEIEKNKFDKLIQEIDEEALKKTNITTLKVYRECYRKCLSEFMYKNAHFEIKQIQTKPTR